MAVQLLPEIPELTTDRLVIRPEVFGSFRNGSIFYNVFWKDDITPIALITVVGRHRPIPIMGWTVVGRHQREGIGYEAASAVIKELAVQEYPSVQAEISSNNVASLALAMKLGFVYHHNVTKQINAFTKLLQI